MIKSGQPILSLANQIVSFIVPNTLTLLSEPKYDLKNNLKLSKSYYLSNFTKGIAEKILNENTSQAEIFWLVITQTYPVSWPNSVIREMLELPAGKACTKLHQHQLLTQETCSHILENEKPEEIDESITRLIEQRLLKAGTVHLILNHSEPKYAASLISLMCNYGMPLPNALKSLTDLEHCLNLIFSYDPSSLSLDTVDTELNLAKLFAILDACSRITSENIVLLKKHVIQSKPEITSVNNKLGKLVKTMSIFQNAGVMNQEQYLYLLEQIQSDTFFDIIFQLDEAQRYYNKEKLLTVAHIKLIKQAPDMDKLRQALYGWSNYVACLTVTIFLEIVDHPDPENLMIILCQLDTWSRILDTTLDLDCIQYECVKNRINIKLFNQLVFSLRDSSLNQTSFNRLIDYADILFSKKDDNRFWLKLPAKGTSWGIQTWDIGQEHLDAIFEACEWINEHNITDRSEQISRLERALEYIPPYSRDRFFRQSNNSITPQPPLVKHIKDLIDKQTNWLSEKELLLAVHPDKHTKTLRDFFQALHINIEQLSSEELQLFTADILDSESTFANILPAIIEFGQKREKPPISSEAICRSL